MLEQSDFNLTIGTLDEVLSKMVIWGGLESIELHNRQTLKHHAEDMIAAGQKILKELGAINGTPQPDIPEVTEATVRVMSVHTTEGTFAALPTEPRVPVDPVRALAVDVIRLNSAATARIVELEVRIAQLEAHPRPACSGTCCTG